MPVSDLNSNKVSDFLLQEELIINKTLTIRMEILMAYTSSVVGIFKLSN
jgi:hypothetical protein